MESITNWDLIPINFDEQSNQSLTETPRRGPEISEQCDLIGTGGHCLFLPPIVLQPFNAEPHLWDRMPHIKPLKVRISTSNGITEFLRSALPADIEPWVELPSTKEQMFPVPLLLVGKDARTGLQACTKVEVVVHVVENAKDLGAFDGVLGMNALVQWGAVLDFKRKEVVVNGVRVQVWWWDLEEVPEVVLKHKSDPFDDRRVGEDCQW